MVSHSRLLLGIHSLREVVAGALLGVGSDAAFFIYFWPEWPWLSYYESFLAKEELILGRRRRQRKTWQRQICVLA
jgi:membrane-associated phospholipid phosphatase